MLKKVHLRLALLCAGIPISILIALSSFCLMISEKNLLDNSFSSFCSDMNTLLANLETQTVFTHEWLSKMEANGKYLISITDNGVEFLWGSQNDTPERRELLAAGRAYCESHILLDEPGLLTSHREFAFSLEGAFPLGGKNAADCYGCAALSCRPDGTLQILVLKPQRELVGQLWRQRILILLLVLAACILLSFFSWHFTGKLLMPVEESRRSQMAFVAAASHELRTPLAVLLSAAGASRRAEGPQRDRFLDICEEEGKSMSRLIDDLLFLASADSQRLRLQTAVCEPDTLLLSIYESFEPLAKEKGYALAIRLPEQPSAPIRCDAERIRQALSILINNAFGHTPAGSRIELKLHQDSRQTLFSVSDNGPGIPEEQKAHIFERFYRGDQSRRSDGHLGLGLSIAAQIMEAHGGRILLEDAPGGGCVFVLVLSGGVR